jgi:uncharacterized membrane protein YgcG
MVLVDDRVAAAAIAAIAAAAATPSSKPSFWYVDAPSSPPSCRCCPTLLQGVIAIAGDGDVSGVHLADPFIFPLTYLPLQELRALEGDVQSDTSALAFHHRFKSIAVVNDTGRELEGSPVVLPDPAPNHTVDEFIRAATEAVVASGIVTRRPADGSLHPQVSVVIINRQRLMYTGLDELRTVFPAPMLYEHVHRLFPEGLFQVAVRVDRAELSDDDPLAICTTMYLSGSLSDASSASFGSDTFSDVVDGSGGGGGGGGSSSSSGSRSNGRRVYCGPLTIMCDRHHKLEIRRLMGAGVKAQTWPHSLAELRLLRDFEQLRPLALHFRPNICEGAVTIAAVASPLVRLHVRVTLVSPRFVQTSCSSLARTV